MKKTIISFCVAVSMLALGPAASALVYTNSDLLLIFHQDGYDDCEFDLGSVSNFLGLEAGTKLAVGDWSTNLVLANFGSYTAANFILMATVPSSTLANDTDWLTCADTSTPTDVSASALLTQVGTIAGVGNYAAANSFDAATNGYAAPTSTVGSYTYVITGGGSGDEETMNGAAPFDVEQSIPGTSRFFQIGVHNGANPPAALQVGSFTVDANGNLTFIAGAAPVLPTAPNLSISTSGGVNTISFLTIGGAKYQLLYSSDLTIPVANWSPVGSSITGDGSIDVLQDTTSATRYYVVEAYY